MKTESELNSLQSFKANTEYWASMPQQNYSKRDGKQSWKKRVVAKQLSQGSQNASCDLNCSQV